MRVFFERSRGACIKIAAKAEAKCELSSLLFAIERCKDGFEVGASVEYLGNDRRRLYHLIASRGLLERVRGSSGEVAIFPSPLAEHYIVEGGRSAFLLLNSIIGSPSQKTLPDNKDVDINARM